MREIKKNEVTRKIKVKETNSRRKNERKRVEREELTDVKNEG